MLWDPEPYVRSALFDVLLELNDFNRIEVLREREGLEPAEQCKYAIRLNRRQPLSDFIVPKLMSIQDHFYCGLWRAEATEDPELLQQTFADDYPLMMDFVQDAGSSSATLPADFEDHLIFIEDPFLMAAAWFQHFPKFGKQVWPFVVKTVTSLSAKNRLSALALFSRFTEHSGARKVCGIRVSMF